MIPNFGPATPIVLIDLGLVAWVWLMALIAGISLFFSGAHFLNRALCILASIFLVIAWLPVFRLLIVDWSERRFWLALLCLPLPAAILTFVFRGRSSQAAQMELLGSKSVWWLNRSFMGFGAWGILSACLYASLAGLIAFLH